ncbi:hypothetical protein P154DRAFT_576177 [Amniculicola lignicola CBS 123094]|uniref:Uncharacterized protein n=1 Tax=Amniculicola lignicola CBS 123094 TaxID=1392246 RepID=A0A6A5WEW0_9PLEO|nr:hypothetical protein P154DRAFT_576177 [Amniculicola lignicola CBS 123094]
MKSFAAITASALFFLATTTALPVVTSTLLPSADAPAVAIIEAILTTGEVKQRKIAISSQTDNSPNPLKWKSAVLKEVQGVDPELVACVARKNFSSTSAGTLLIGKSVDFVAGTQITSIICDFKVNLDL